MERTMIEVRVTVYITAADDVEADLVLAHIRAAGATWPNTPIVVMAETSREAVPTMKVGLDAFKVGDAVAWTNDDGEREVGLVHLTFREEPWLGRSGEVAVGPPEAERLRLCRPEELELVEARP
jgi:hypothetical protein